MVKSQPIFTDVEVREATLDDVIGLVYVQATTWIKDFQSPENGITEADLRSIDFHHKVRDWQHLILSANYRVWVAARPDEIVGFIAARPDEIVGFIAARKDETAAEIYEQCILPAYQRHGIGSKLLEQAISWIGQLPTTLRIISYNQKGVAFYKKHGFRVSTIGEVDFLRLPTGKSIATIEMTNAPQETSLSPSQPIQGLDTMSKPHKQLVGRSELAKISNVRASTIKFYTEIGLLPYQQAEARLARRYELDKALARLQEIQELRQQGLSVKQISERLQ